MRKVGLPPVLPWRRTPLLYSKSLSRQANCQIYLKLENLQPSGSFKSRGIGNLLLKSAASVNDISKLHFCSSSGGNAGLGCVHAAVAVGAAATVVVPMSTSQYMISKIREAGAAAVIQHGKSWAEADAYLKTVFMSEARSKGIEAVYVHPFDHEDIWEGHSSMVDEVLEQLGEQGQGPPDVVVCSCGGGGLLTGVVRGLDRHQLGHTTKVLVMETKGCDSLSQAVDARKLITLPAITSICGSLGARTVCKEAFECGLRPNITSCVLTDEEAAMACVRFANDERIMLEIACGINVATCYNGRLQQFVPELQPDTKVVIVVCGGSNINTSMLRQYEQDWGSIKFGNDVPTAFTADA